MKEEIHKGISQMKEQRHIGADEGTKEQSHIGVDDKL
jgi:hypothetical protein